MERLTESNPSWIDDELWESACEPDCEEIDAVYRKLKEYEDLEEQGRLIRLPCKVGDTVYVPTRNFISELRITEVVCNRDGTYLRWVLLSGIYPNLNGFVGRKIGNEVFLTRSEAEAKLEELRGKQNEREEDK